MLQRFIGIGAQKCASSWMHEILADHPQVVVPDVKELDYFSYRYENGHRWYASRFRVSEGARALGEISPSYFHEPAAVERAHAFDQDMKILVSLRDPVERALSQHRHLARLGLLPPDDLTFESALAVNPTYIEQGLYHRHLSRWIDAFGRSQVHVVLMEDVRARPADVSESLYAFLGLDTTHRAAALDQRSNASYIARSRALDRTVGLARGTIRRMGLGKVWTTLGDSGLRRAYRAANRRAADGVLPAPAPETLSHLRAQFAPEIEALAPLIGRDLSAWLPEGHLR